VYWHFNDESVGRSRWNVSRHALAYYITKEVAKQADGSRAANIAGITLLSNNGEFADDQFAAFDADNDVFNGLDAVGQRYLRQRCRVTIEHWYSNLFEPLFVGRIDEELFTRESALGDVSRVNITCEDAVGEVARKSLPYGRLQTLVALYDSMSRVSERGEQGGSSCPGCRQDARGPRGRTGDALRLANGGPTDCRYA